MFTFLAGLEALNSHADVFIGLEALNSHAYVSSGARAQGGGGWGVGVL